MPLVYLPSKHRGARWQPSFTSRLNLASWQANSLLACYPLSTPKEKRAHDLRRPGRELDVPANNPLAVQDPRFGRVSRFTRTEGRYYYRSITPSLLRGATNGTVMLWCKMDSAPSAQAYYFMYNQYTRPFLISLYGTTIRGRWRAALVSDAATTITGFDFTEWHHYATSYDSGGGTKLFVDGVEVAEDTGVTGTLYDVADGPIRLADSSSGIDGEMFDARVYDRTLSPGEIFQIYKDPLDLYRESPRFGFFPAATSTTIVNRFMRGMAEGIGRGIR